MRDVTDITVLLDRSGSMRDLRGETITAVNRFIAEQQAAPGEATFTLILFDNQDPQEVVQRAVPILDARPLTPETYAPRGWTPLLDAMGRCLTDTAKRLAGEATDAERPERLIRLEDDAAPGKVVLVVMTDGLENASREWTRERVFAAIKARRETDGWEVVFLGANQDAIQEGGKVGVTMANALTYAADGAGMADVYASLSRNLVSYRSGAARDMTFSAADRDAQARKGASQK